MNEDVYKQLSQEQMTPFHEKMLEVCKNLVKMSRSEMSKYYDTWDKHDMAYRGEHLPDQNDKAAKEKGDPIKMAIPLTYAQIQTFIAFCFSLFFQRKAFFELIGTGPEDHVAAKIGEATIERDLRHNRWASKLYEALLNVARFNIGVIKVGWTKEVAHVVKETTTPVAAVKVFGIEVMPAKNKTVSESIMETKYLGNRLNIVSPYRFFPDVRLPITRFQEGEFCASEDEYTKNELKSMQSDKLIAGLEFVPALAKDDMNVGRYTGINRTDKVAMAKDVESTIVVTEVQIKIIPSEFETEEGKKLGPETYAIKYNVWIANDKRIIKCEPLGYVHDDFTYVVGQLSPDQHKLMNESISDLCSALQDVINWFLNTHIKNVRQVLSNFLVVDTAGVEIADIQARKPVIRLKPGVARQGVDKWIKQLTVTDVTQSHVKDITLLQSFMQIVTGISENAMGQFHGGRRSAQEARVVNAATSNRLLMWAKILWTDLLEPMGEQMLSNLQDGLDEETFVRLTGDVPNLIAFNRFTKADKSTIAGNYDFEVFDGTLPSEKMSISNALFEVLQTIIQNPEGAAVLGFNPQTIMLEAATLQGIPSPERFLMPQAQMQLAQMGLVAPPAGAPNPGAPQPQPQGIPPNGQSGITGQTPNAGPGPVGATAEPSIGNLLAGLVK